MTNSAIHQLVLACTALICWFLLWSLIAINYTSLKIKYEYYTLHLLPEAPSTVLQLLPNNQRRKLLILLCDGSSKIRCKGGTDIPYYLLYETSLHSIDSVVTCHTLAISALRDSSNARSCSARIRLSSLSFTSFSCTNSTHVSWSILWRSLPENHPKFKIVNFLACVLLA